MNPGVYMIQRCVLVDGQGQGRSALVLVFVEPCPEHGRHVHTCGVFDTLEQAVEGKRVFTLFGHPLLDANGPN